MGLKGIRIRLTRVFLCFGDLVRWFSQKRTYVFFGDFHGFPLAMLEKGAG
jgi:hypothetical protein